MFLGFLFCILPAAYRPMIPMRSSLNKVGVPVIQALSFHDCRHTAASIIRSLRIPPIVVAGMLGHSLAILITTFVHLARFARFLHNIPRIQDEPLGFASLASAARLMDEILTPIPIDLKSPKP
jgi:integrase